jgi:hypothetical protein
MHKFFFGLIIIYFYLSESIIVKQNFEIERYSNQSSMIKNELIQTLSSYVFPKLIPATPVKNQNWNEYIVISGSNFVNNNYRKNGE